MNLEKLEERAQALAGELGPGRLLRGPFRRRAAMHLRRLDQHADRLRAAYRAAADDVHRGEALPPAAEWLLDNFHMVEAEVRNVRHDLPRGYHRRLPRATSSAGEDRARIEILAEDLLAHSDGRLEAARVTRYLAAFQTVAPLSIGELWAWPSVLKLALLARLREHTDGLLTARASRKRALEFLHEIDTAAAIDRLPNLPATVDVPFVVQLVQRLREYGSTVAPLRAALDERLAAEGRTIEEAIRDETQRQATEQISVANVFTSLRFCATEDWRELFERASLIEHVLQRDPAGVYARMDFLSRDRYRHVVESLAGPRGEDQVDVAQRCVDTARSAAEQPHSNARSTHVGAHLIGDDRMAFQATLPRSPSWSTRLHILAFRHATLIYLGTLALVTGIGIAAAGSYAAAHDASWLVTLAAALLAFVPASELATALVQRMVAARVRPRRLVRLDFQHGLIPGTRTLVVIPTILGDAERAREMVAHLEVQALANPDPLLHFALLTDLRDATAETLPGDAAIVEAAQQGIEELNRRHGGSFYLFHRRRRFNPAEGLWMGWERKRGKLEELNRLLRGDRSTSYELAVGDLDVLSDVTYCLTLDSDTVLPRNVARQLIGLAAHPLNRPHYDPREGRVTSGYTILQPHVSVTLASAAGSLFARLYAGHTGVDPYTTAVSDVYQDLFGEGIFTGKGLYEVDAFRTALEGRVPENALLSHDLFEGLHARCALVTDVELVDDYPASVLAHARRQHRWVRGDWQILFWMFPWVPTAHGLARNRLPVISRFKIFDNLRRSLAAPGLLAMLLAGWLWLPGHPGVWTAAVLAVAAAPVWIALAPILRGPGATRTVSAFLRGLAEDLMTAGARVVLTLTLLAFHAWETLHAVLLTLVRVFITQRRLLEWETAATASARTAGLMDEKGARVFLVEMAASPVAAALTLASVMLAQPAALPWALLLAALWMAAPFVAYHLSRPVRVEETPLAEADRALFCEAARRTWDYFATFVGADDHWLPPDNFQEDPGAIVAHRTSPTNIGLALLAHVAAHDLGFLPTPALIDRLENMMDGIESLERWEGHLLNWYDTQSLAPLAPRYVSTVDSGNLVVALMVLAAALDELLASGEEPYAGASTRIRALAARARTLADGTDFQMLYDARRRLFAVGYRLPDAEGPGRLDTSFYDLLASEARLASFIAIAKGDVPARHWFALGRPLTSIDGRAALLSWSATAFEYLLPLLFTRRYPETLLDNACAIAVLQQRRYATRLGVPWGISESAYYFLDRAGHYQYRAFGVPGLGLKRGLADELVIAPYATALAALIDAPAAAANLRDLAAAGLSGRYGFYEAIDYTPRADGDEPNSQAAEERQGKIVRAYFAHHQAMSLVAFANVLDGARFVARFHADPRVQATELLLQERVPRDVPIVAPRPAESTRVLPPPAPLSTRRFRSPHTAYPHAHFLSNGSYTTAVTNGGGGGSWCRGQVVTRLRPDATRDVSSHAIYLRDVRSGVVWSATHQPTQREADDYLVHFLPEKAVFRRRDDGIETQLDVAVSPEDDVEVRRLAVSNRDDRVREIEVTSYAEIVLGDRLADVAHPAFGKLFVETEYLPEHTALLCRRRPRASTETPLVAMHVLSIEGGLRGSVEWETDRAAFLGRGRDPSDPIALDGRPLSGCTGAVLDPVVSLRYRLRLPPGGFARLNFATGIAVGEPAARALAQKYHEYGTAGRAMALAFTHAQIALRHLGLSSDEAQLFERLASRVFWVDPTLRAAPEVRAQNVRGQSGLWQFGISGDLPIVVVVVVEAGDTPLVQQVLQAQEYWRLKGLAADVVVLNEHAEGYRSEMHERLGGLLDSGPWAGWRNRPAGVHLLRGETIAEPDRVLLLAAARAVLHGERGELADQLDRPYPEPRWTAARGTPTPRSRSTTLLSQTRFFTPPPLLFANGLGGFATDGRAYVIVLDGDADTPRPWSNVLANPSFGSLVTQAGPAFTWSENSRENRLTPFANDPVSDFGAERFYLRDDQSGAVWGLTPGAMARTPESPRWVVNHAPGVTRYQHEHAELAHELAVFVAVDDPVKLSTLTIANGSTTARHLRAFAYCEWSLGAPRPEVPGHVVTEHDPTHGAVLARNAYSEDFPDRVAFLAAAPQARSATADRLEFLGRYGDPRRPAALGREGLAGLFGAALDPCGALEVEIEIPPGEERTVTFLIGQGRDRAHAEALLARYTTPAAAAAARGAVEDFWAGMLGTIQVRTPDDSFDVLMNGWLPYQAMAARLFARCGYDQPGGAFGFRDQLQDVMALGFARPDLWRAQLLRAAARQFVEGDVQHWWHPPLGRGTRTRCSDDLLWLPLAAERYVTVSGDAAVWEEVVPFLDGKPLDAGEHETYDLPKESAERATLFEHCLRAIDHSITAGPHGLPLIGSGDWNDGMNRVGAEGRGESVWLGFFLGTILRTFADLCEQRGDAERAARYRGEVSRLTAMLELAWDGDWYLRGYFDDGTPFGSARNPECRLDSLPQSWAVLSGLVPVRRAERALDAVRAHLVRRPLGLILLLTPPFDHAEPDPGYIRGYPPGIRENGGQYSHAAMWTVLALTRIGAGDEAVEMFHLLNPINHAREAASAQRYGGEPYVLAGDVWSHPMHAGRAGWTWYTGSASWMYRAGLEGILGIQRRGERLVIDPCLPTAWPSCTVVWTRGRTRYEIGIENPERRSRGVTSVELDGRPVEPDAIHCPDDGGTHRIRVVLGDAAAYERRRGAAFGA